MQRVAAVTLCTLVVVIAGCGKPESPPPASPRSPAETSTGAPPGTLRIGIPCGLVPAYNACKELFLAENPDITFEEDIRNIDPLTKAVLDGKVELDIYLGLGERETDSVVAKGLARGEPTPFLTQSLRLMVPSGNPLGIRAIEDLAGPQVRTVAICTDDLAIGQAAVKVLQGAGVWDELEKDGRIIRLPQPAQTKELVFSGKADATFVFGACTDESWTDADPERATQGKAEVILTVPDELYGGMKAQAVILTTARSPELAERFVQFLLRPECQEAVTQWGYDPI